MQEINTYIKPIIMKRKKHDFKAWIEYRKIIKLCDKTSPSFKQMCEISQFIDILMESYMYGNNKDFHLFATTYPKGHTRLDTCTMCYKEETFSVSFILFKETRKINIEINRSGQTMNKREQISFIDGEYQFKDIYDQEKFLFITSCLMNGVKELITYYYKNKKI